MPQNIGCVEYWWRMAFRVLSFSFAQRQYFTKSLWLPSDWKWGPSQAVDTQGQMLSTTFSRRWLSRPRLSVIDDCLDTQPQTPILYCWSLNLVDTFSLLKSENEPNSFFTILIDNFDDTLQNFTSTTKCHRRENKTKRSYSQLDSRKQVIAF